MSDHLLVKGLGVMTRDQAIATVKTDLLNILHFASVGDFDNARCILASGVLIECLEALSPNKNNMLMINGQYVIDLVNVVGKLQ